MAFMAARFAAKAILVVVAGVHLSAPLSKQNPTKDIIDDVSSWQSPADFCAQLAADASSLASVSLKKQNI